jgi:hypothetical protein
MKIALCLSGHFRTFQKTHGHFLRHVLIPLMKRGEVDTFISTWRTLYPKRGWYQPKELPPNYDDDLNIPEVQRIYAPKRFIVEDFDGMRHTFFKRNFSKNECAEPKIWDGQMLYSTPMFYKILSANALKCQHEEEKKFTYDLVIRIRPDQIFQGDINEDIFNDLGKLSILHADEAGTERRVDDTFFSGSSETMDKACSLFYNLVDIFEKMDFEPCGPEAMFGLHLKLRGVETRIVKQSHMIIR